jgi:hypothetical protein
MQMKTNDRRMLRKKKKKKTKLKVKSTKKKKSKRRNRSVDTNKSSTATRKSNVLSPQSEDKRQSGVSSTTKILSKDVAKLKTLFMFEPWIKRDELDVRNSSKNMFVK